MSNSYARLRLITRFLAGGALNTAFGVGVIFALMLAGVSALVANAGGYVVGLLLSFAVNRGFVFRAKGTVGTELGRFVTAFAASYVANLLVLYVLVQRAGVDKFVGQVAAVAAYVVLMFVLCQAFVFRKRDA